MLNPFLTPFVSGNGVGGVFSFAAREPRSVWLMGIILEPYVAGYL